MADKHLLNALLKKRSPSKVFQFKLILGKFSKQLFDRTPSDNYF